MVRVCRLMLVVLPLLAGCGGGDTAPPQVFAPLSYAYLRPLRLNVGTIDVTDAWAAGPGDLSGLSPVTPVDALHQMARDRLLAAGASGRAVFTVEQASIVREGDMLNGLMKVRVDIYTSDGQRAAFTEAAVAHSATVPGDDDAMRAALYEFTKTMMSDMNVEFEYQLGRTLGDWMQSSAGPAPPPAPVQQQSLAPVTGLPGPGVPAGPGQKFRLVPVAPTPGGS